MSDHNSQRVMLQAVASDLERESYLAPSDLAARQRDALREADRLLVETRDYLRRHAGGGDRVDALIAALDRWGA